MASASRRHALQVWATLVYWTGKAAGVLVVEARGRADGRHEFVATGGRRRAWNVACLAAVAYRMHAQTWPVTARAAETAQATCYDSVCGGVWCVYACVYYAVAWLDRTSEIGALLAAATWRRRSTAECLNSAATECFDDNREDGDNEEDGDERRPSAADVPWHAYLTVAFPIVHFATVANALSPARNGVWHAAAATVAAVASCAPVAAHGSAVALLVVANNGMRSINHRITRLSPSERRRLGDDDDDRPQRAVIVRLARRHWATTELVTGGVCDAYGVDLMAAVLLAAVRVTYVAISVFHRLTDDDNAVAAQDSRINVSLAVVVVVQLIAWFGQFAYLAYTCDELTAQSSEMFDNLNSLLLDTFKESRLSGEKYSSTLHEIEAVQEFMRQVVARKVVVHACCGLITLNLSLITTVSLRVSNTQFISAAAFFCKHNEHALFTQRQISNT